MKKLFFAILCTCFTMVLFAQKSAFKKLPKKLRNELSGLVYIQGDTFYSESPDTIGKLNFKKTAVGSFYMDATEVSNFDWNNFYYSNAIEHKGEEVKWLLPDSTVWYKSPVPFNEPMVEYYYRHPAYINYPVVGVSYNMVQAYIKWKNEMMAWFLKKNNITGYSITFRLPTALEMEYILMQRFNFKLLSQKYGYNFHFGKIVDVQGYNCKGALGGGLHQGNGEDMTAPVKSYRPNAFGLYNIKGNVEEWTNTPYNPTNELFPLDTNLTLQPGATETTRYRCMGGSWVDGPYYLQQGVYRAYPANAATSFTGFRVAMDIVEVKPAAGK